MSQFESRWDPLVLLQVVPRVLRAADPDRPDAVSQRAYNAAREIAGYPDSPRADKIAARFNVSWSRLTSVVIAEANPLRTLSKSDYSRAQRWRSDAEIASALRTAAGWLGTDHINAASYERARAAINAAGKRRHLHGRGFVPLPSAVVIGRRLPFADAVAAAGLRATPRQSTPPMPRHEIVRLIVEHCGFVPRKADVEHFARHHDIRLADQRTSPPHARVVTDVKAEFNRLGRWFPFIGRNATPDDAIARIEADGEGARLAAERYPSVRERGYTLDEVRGSIAAAFDLLEPGQRLTPALYKRLRLVNPELVPYTQVGLVANAQGLAWTNLVREATTERADAARSQTAPPSDR